MTSDRVSKVFRTWRTERLEAVTGELLVSAYDAGREGDEMGEQ